jgi:adenosylcobinamide-GDP ribazoletransferase
VIRAVLAAFALLTRLPIRRAFDVAEVARSAAFFPIVGAAIGGVQVMTFWLCAIHVRADGAMEIGDPHVPPLVLAVGLVTLGVWLTGALHLDGLADTVDGLGGGQSPEGALRIMRDPTIGAFGAIAIGLLLLMKVACLSALLEWGAAIAPLLAAPVLGRWSIVLHGRWLPYARTEGGLGAVMSDEAARRALIIATALTGVIAVGVSGTQAWWFGAATLAVTSVVNRICRRRLGGFTGDTLGATEEVSEVAVWLVAVVIRS